MKVLFLRIWGWVWKTLSILFILHLFYILLLRWVNPPITTTQLSRWMNGDGLTRDYVGWDEISVPMKLAVISSEDQLFPFHNGFDWKSIQEAAQKNKKSKRVRGASTISQQVAKNVFLWQGRSWLRKGLEVYFTFMIELAWGKKRILEVYLNVAETGKGTFGVEAAARKYFKKPASKLTQTEAAMIAAALPNPKRYTLKPVSSYVLSHYGHVVTQMNNLIFVPEVADLVNAP
ncbi:MAG TPA: monofunctional biosynthetic peptidoglycan transglycosylase [Cyclobacteriaceae bacterium]|nr:monofunctional biosynthetic peptidoglycan transglycosylase [Cyclobacteriaceae bacterium]